MSGSLFASLKFKVKCKTLEQYSLALGLLDEDEINDRICSWESDGWGLQVEPDEDALEIVISMYNTDVNEELDDFLTELHDRLAEQDIELTGQVRYQTEDGEHLRGDFSVDDALDFESVDYFLGYTVEQIRELQKIARQKWGRPNNI